MRRFSRAALVPYLVAGDPRPEATVPCMHALADAGADLTELGVPFSDPMAEGPVMRRAHERALAHRVGVGQALGVAAESRAADACTPVVLMGYANSLSRDEPSGFARAAHRASRPRLFAPPVAQGCHRRGLLAPRRAYALAWRRCADAPAYPRAFGASAGVARRQLAGASLKGRLSVCRDADPAPETHRAGNAPCRRRRGRPEPLVDRKRDRAQFFGASFRGATRDQRGKKTFETCPSDGVVL